MPPAYVVGPDGRRWHSWRTLLLPYLEYGDLYNAYNLEQPWDSPDNLRLARNPGRSLNTFRRPEDPDPGSILTKFVAVVGPRTAFPGAGSLRFDDITDGLPNTISFVEIAESDILWSEPRDLPFDRMSFRLNDPDHPALSIGSPYGDARGAFADGSVRHLDDSLTPPVLRALLTANGGEPIERNDERGWHLADATRRKPGAGP